MGLRRASTPLLVLTTAAALLAGACESKTGGDGQTNADGPIVVGSTLSLSGAFAATGIIHKLAGEQFVARLNARGGLLGRQVEWIVRDDESDQAKVTGLYEQLITQDKVDLIIGPYATPNILSAMAVAERHGFTMPQHTAVLAPLLTYDCQFPGWSIGSAPNEYVPGQLFDAVATWPTPPKKVAILTNQNGSTDFVAYGAGDNKVGFVALAKQRGLDVVAEVRYPPDTRNWSTIAAEVRDADPDLVVNSGLGVDPVNLLQAMAQLRYQPPAFFSLFPAPGPPLGLGATAEGMLAVSLFEPNEATLTRLGGDAQAIVTEFASRAKAADLPYQVFETQAAASWNAWEILVAGVTGAGSLNQKAICDALHAKGATTTFSGQLTFDPAANNFWPSTSGLKQIQDGDWVTVWPADRAAAPLRPPAG
jgi:branched-chain amino acid transport system substrate-binding protein